MCGMELSGNILKDRSELRVSVDVKNTGALEGSEVVQLYARQMYRSISPPIRELKSFKKISIKPGETVTVKFTITPVDLAFVGLSDKWTTEKGEFQLFVDKFAERFELQ